MGKLGLRYPPASTVDRDSHAARVALLAEDCAEIPADWLDWAAREWAKTEPFMPRACELREKALMFGRSLTWGKRLAAPYPPPIPERDRPPLTEAEIANLPSHLVDMGVKLGEIDPAIAARLKDAA